MSADLALGDSRRAVGLLWHTLGPDPSAEGVVATLQDAQEGGRSVHVVLALLQLVGQVAPFLGTPDGHLWMRKALDFTANAEATELAEGEA